MGPGSSGHGAPPWEAGSEEDHGWEPRLSSCTCRGRLTDRSRVIGPVPNPLLWSQCPTHQTFWVLMWPPGLASVKYFLSITSRALASEPGGPG